MDNKITKLFFIPAVSLIHSAIPN